MHVNKQTAANKEVLVAFGATGVLVLILK